MITIIALADGHGHFESAIEVYKQRLEKTVHFQLLRPISAQDVPTIVRKESLLLSDVLSRKRQHTVYLDVLGTPFSTEDFAMKLAQWQATFGDVRFVIGWAYGVDMAIVGAQFDERWSLGKMTLPHSLAFLVMVEQIYRAKEIQKGSKYHHA